MPARKRPAVARVGLLQQISEHIIRNGMTTMFGLCVGMPEIVAGYKTEDWHRVGKGLTDVLLGASGSDRFGIKEQDQDE